jgi:hypothetical protein
MIIVLEPGFTGAHCLPIGIVTTPMSAAGRALTTASDVADPVVIIVLEASFAFVTSGPLVGVVADTLDVPGGIVTDLVRTALAGVARAAWKAIPIAVVVLEPGGTRLTLTARIPRLTFTDLPGHVVRFTVTAAGQRTDGTLPASTQDW